MTSLRMVYKMATVGCSSMESKEMGDKCGAKIALVCKKNGVNPLCCCEERLGVKIPCRSQLLDKFKKLNGSVKANNNNSFSRPSAPTLRSRRERHSSGPEFSKRRRRSSRHENGETVAGGCPDTGQTELESLEVAALTCKATAPIINCNNGPHTKEMKEPIPLVSDTPSVPVTPDTSRSCTPQSLTTCPRVIPTPTPADKDANSRDLCTPATCLWRDCDKHMDSGEVMDHIRTCHVVPQNGNETFVCLWKGCKVFNKNSCSRSWLDRHILSHSGDKPFRCIVAGCGARFTSQKGLERHVNSHFSAQEQQTPNHKHSKTSREDTPTKLFKRKRLKQRGRLIGVKTTDYFDTGIMETLQQQLNAITEKTQIDLNGSNNSVTFHSTVIARRTEESGKIRVLLHWTPEDILPDDWVLESQVATLQTCSIPINRLPPGYVQNLHPSFYNQHRYRRHRRK